ncbi:TonB-dependent receptor domain-containing protein [Sphingosinicella sp. CPCC 101087]|uniref:TonB-dependent receptor domain-containing protein n=1 Tax=Sphingosinicella sp. CPCC 101087 TaxID=2497754 RepID=UPI00198197C8|nr:TonB-dependent receptor [Sphingosinicella sp. CPCC 101087]
MSAAPAHALAQADATSGPGSRSAAPPTDPASPAEDLPAADSSASAELGSGDTGGEIIVTGSRLARGGFDAPSPLTVVGRDRLDNLAQSNVGDALNQLPAFRATGSPNNQQVQISNIGARVLDLRGLGAARTLVLVDGRRFVPSTNQGTVDLNLIPSILLSRVEVVTGGASAAYGSDAVAGVVNLLIDDRLESIRGEVQGGISQRGDNQNFLASLAGGTSLLDGTARVVAAVEYEKSDGMGDCFSRDWCAVETSLVGRPAGRFDVPSLSIFQNVRTASMAPGGVINAGPLRGIQFAPDGTPIPFEYGLWPVLFMQGGGAGPGTNPFLFGFPLRPAVERVSVYAHGEAELGSSINAFADLSYGRVVGRTRGAMLRDTGTVMGPIRRENPFIPGTIADQMDALGLTQFNFGRSGFDIGPTEGRTRSETWRAVAGLDGRLGGSWQWDAYYQYGRTDYAQRANNNISTARLRYAVDAVRDESGEIVCRATRDGSDDPLAAGCSPLNLFGQSQFTPEALDYVTGTSRQWHRVEQHVVAANVRGDLFSTWAGPVPVAIGAEYRNDRIAGSADDLSLLGGWYTANGQRVRGRIEVKEAYAEAAVPLLADLPFARKLEVNGAIRLTDYSTSGQVTTWKGGAIYEPFEVLRLRATISRDIRAPNLTELFGSGTSTFTGVADPLNGGAQVFVRLLSGSNRELRPERADTWTVGAVIQPEALVPGLRASIDYYSIEIDNAIGILGQQTIVDRCAEGATELCQLVTRNSGGVITEVRNILLNVDSLRTRGFDVEIDYRTRVGNDMTLSVRGLGTYVSELITTDVVGSIDRAGQTGYRAGTVPGLPRYTVDGMVTLEGRTAGLTLHGRYIPKGKFSVLHVGPEDPGYDVSLPNSINTNRVPARFYLNLAGRIRVPVNDDRKVEFFAAVNNLFDRDPPRIPGPSGGTNQILFDPVGREFRVGLRFEY